MSARIQHPEKLGYLFRPARYKVAYGGRGSGKSWAYARALLIQGAKEPLRIGCFREVQKSIKQSVHQLLTDQIQALGLGQFYEVLETEIRGMNGTLFVFAGLAGHTVESIKSYEGLDRAWVEEAQTVSKKSWDILIPTIRAQGSEIWVSFNPSLDTDDTWTRFVESPPPDSVVCKVNWHDNPWFPAVLDSEREHCRLTRPRDYDNIWEGKCKAAVDGAIYADEIAEAQEKGRIRNVPYDPLLKVHVVFDLGWNDAMAISLVQKQASEIRIIDYIEDSHKTLDHYSQVLRAKGMNWGRVWLPHDGAHKDFKTGKSAEEIMKAMGWKVSIVPRQDIEGGIRLARMMFPRAYIDRERCDRLVKCLKNYKRAIPASTNEPAAPLHDEWSHGADNFRYIATAVEQMSNDDWGGELNYKGIGIV